MNARENGIVVEAVEKRGTLTVLPVEGGVRIRIRKLELSSPRTAWKRK